jgi:hypothetical protein
VQLRRLLGRQLRPALQNLVNGTVKRLRAPPGTRQHPRRLACLRITHADKRS